MIYLYSFSVPRRKGSSGSTTFKLKAPKDRKSPSKRRSRTLMSSIKLWTLSLVEMFKWKESSTGKLTKIYDFNQPRRVMISSIWYSCKYLESKWLPKTKTFLFSGKARRGDGNDLTANPKKLAAIGRELDHLGKVINDLTPVSEMPFNTRCKSRKEKNKLASRACRLKKKAQHEANKVKCQGLEEEHRKLTTSVW